MLCFGKVEAEKMGKERKTNWVEMMGEAVREPAFSHSYGGEDYFLFPFRCLRLSGVEDPERAVNW